MANGTLYLLPVWLGDAGGTDLLPAHNTRLAERITLFFCENERTARRMLRRMSPTLDLNAIELHVLDKDTPDADVKRYAHLMQQRDAAILSEAGMPCIADPGARLVSEAHALGIPVVPLTGPSSLFLALAASGMNGQRFAFHGYLPREAAARKQAIQRIEQDALRTGAAQLFIETPYRNDALLTDLLSTCNERTRLCLAVDLDQPGGSAITRSIGAWRKHVPTLGKRPCVFVLGS